METSQVVLAVVAVGLILGGIVWLMERHGFFDQEVLPEGVKKSADHWYIATYEEYMLTHASTLRENPLRFVAQRLEDLGRPDKKGMTYVITAQGYSHFVTHDMRVPVGEFVKQVMQHELYPYTDLIRADRPRRYAPMPFEYNGTVYYTTPACSIRQGDVVRLPNGIYLRIVPERVNELMFIVKPENVSVVPPNDVKGYVWPAY